MTTGSYDAVVIGGGVTGAGVARDLARRGISTLLLEKGDYGAGTSGGSSWMIHGGPRYLEFDWRTTRLSCEDAGRIVRIARHLVQRVVFLLPVMPGDRNNLERMETAMEVYDRYQPLKLSNPHVRLTPAEALQLEPGLTPHLVGALTMEEWGVDPFRLAWLTVLDAVEHGARALNHAQVTGFLTDAGRIIGVRFRGPDGAHHEARAQVVVNATGPWSPQTAALAGAEVHLRPAKGIHIVYDRRLSNFAISAEAVDGRGLLMVPHGATTLVGTTDDDFYGDLDSIEVLEDEVDYILQAMDRVMPGLRQHRPLRSTSGVRPTLYQWRLNEDNLSRRHQLVDHGVEGGPPGLVSIVGGKLSMYRLMAEETGDLVAARLGIHSRSDTGEAPLPGSEGDPPPAAELAARHGLSGIAASRLLGRHGTRADAVLAAGGGTAIGCRCEQVTVAELRHAATREQVRDLGDAFRRVGLAAGPCAGTGCIGVAAAVIGESLGWSRAQTEAAAADFTAHLWRGRWPVLDSTGWAQEELRLGATGG